MKVVNLYSGLGGNRKLWTDVEVTALELDLQVAAVYKRLYPDDNIIIGDAHKYLLKHYQEYDFIWASPPCQTHSSFRQNICVRYRGTPPVYPDMKLWQEIVFLQANCDTKWVVENVKPYYPPFIKPTVELERHLFWSNFNIPEKVFDGVKIRKAQIPQLSEYHGLNLENDRLSNKRQLLRNCVHYDLGNHIFNASRVWTNLR